MQRALNALSCFDIQRLNFPQENVRGIQWVKNYKFDFRFQQWGQCSVTFTCVAGHIVAQDFNERFKKWHSCQPAALFDAPIESSIAEVRTPYSHIERHTS
jgi:hypothetical protein